MLIQSILFTKDECESIINLKNKYPLLGDNGRWDEFDNFRYKFYALEYLTDIDWIIKRMCDFFEDEMKLHIYTRPTKLNLHHFTVGDEFGKHIDTGNPIKEWNVGIVLNEDFIGGDYIIYDVDDNPIVINKKVGNVCIFQSQIPHQVTPLIKGERWSIAMFIHKFRMEPNKNKLI
jgi:hypothetical protein